MKVRIEILNELRENGRGDGASSENRSSFMGVKLAMLCKEEFGAALIVKLLSEKESEDKDEVTEGGGMMSSSKFVGGGGVGLSCL